MKDPLEDKLVSEARKAVFELFSQSIERLVEPTVRRVIYQAIDDTSYRGTYREIDHTISKVVFAAFEYATDQAAHQATYKALQ